MTAPSLFTVLQYKFYLFILSSYQVYKIPSTSDAMNKTEKIAAERKKIHFRGESSINIKYTSISILWIRSESRMWIILREGEINKNQNRTPTIWDLLPSLLLLVYSSDITAEMIFSSPSRITLLRIHMPVTPPQKMNRERIWFGFDSREQEIFTISDHCRSHHEFMAGWLVAVLNGNVTILYESLP